jgi:uncharacterized phage-associated protein
MARVDDVAAAILDRTGETSTFKLQKLVYYSQAWHLVWDDERLFGSRIEAWANGPVCRELYDLHRQQFTVASWPAGDPARLTQDELETIEAVVSGYGHLSGTQLSQLTHAEDPWRDARVGLRPGERGNREISPAAMAEYYGGLAPDSPDVEDV